MDRTRIEATAITSCRSESSKQIDVTLTNQRPPTHKTSKGKVKKGGKLKFPDYSETPSPQKSKTDENEMKT